MCKCSKNNDFGKVSKGYLETIILKLDRMEAELDTVKSVIFGYTRETTLLKDKIGYLEEKICI